MVVDIARAEPLAREFLQIEIFLVSGARGSDDTELAAAGFDPGELPGYGCQRLRPGHRLQRPSDLHQRRLQPRGVVVEIERVAALETQELAVDSRLVAVIGANDLVVAHAQRG